MNIKTGDLIVAHHMGFHEVIRIEERNIATHGTDSPLIHYRTKYNERGEIVKSSVVRCCDSTFCKLASVSIPERISTEAEIHKRLLTLI